MPIYDFHCPKCQKTFEELAFGDTCPPCPVCQGETTRCVSAPSPLKTGAFPFPVGKPAGPVLAPKSAAAPLAGSPYK